MSTELSSSWRVYVRMVSFALVVLYAVGTVGHGFDASLPLMLALTPWFMLLIGLLVVAPSIVAGGWRFALWAAGAFAFALLAEAASVATGAVYGHCQFGPVLGAKWMGVPLVVVFQWVLVVHGLVCLACRGLPWSERNWRKPAAFLLVGFMAMGIDYLMEPVAIRLEYWSWRDGDVPLQNYGARFAVAMLAAIFHPRVIRHSRAFGTNGKLAAFFVVAQAVFYLALGRVS